MILGKELVFPIVIAVVAGVAVWDHRNRQRRLKATEPVPDRAADEPYKAYTTAFDLILRGEDVPQRLEEASDDVFKGKFDWGGKSWRQKVEAAKRWMAEHPQPADLAQRLADALRHAGLDPADVAITLLVDQSASMRGDPIAAVQAAAAHLSFSAARVGARLEILGFSTAGWDGGFARKQWVSAGRPPRPGRLSTLLHIIYKEHAEPEWLPASRGAMMHPDILRENIDGEALEWAASRLRNVAAGTRILLVITDGAAADDTTVMHNGKAYLERHLRKIVAEIEARGDIRLGALGMRYDASPHYRACGNTDPEGLPEALASLLLRLVAEAPARAATAAA